MTTDPLQVLIVGGTGTFELLTTGTKIRLDSDGTSLRLCCLTCRDDRYGSVDDMIMKIVPFIQSHTHPH